MNILEKISRQTQRICMFQNIAFLSTDKESSQLLLSKLFQLGLPFTSSIINGKFHYMIVTNNLKVIKNLAKTYNCGKFYVSDNRRTLFEVSLNGGLFSPINLGTLKRAPQPQESSGVNNTGAFCLVVTEANRTYYYEAQQNVEETPQL